VKYSSPVQEIRDLVSAGTPFTVSIEKELHDVLEVGDNWIKVRAAVRGQHDQPEVWINLSHLRGIGIVRS
jgi:hypothetical protein